MDETSSMGIILAFIALLLTIILGIVIPLYRWATKATATLGNIQVLAAELIQMHKHPDEHEFGTKKTNEMLEGCVKEQTLLLQQMVHYLQWYIEESTGKTPPPFIQQP